MVEDIVDTDSESPVNSVNKTLKLKPVNLSIDDKHQNEGQKKNDEQRSL